jgi:hypothetical protein
MRCFGQRSPLWFVCLIAVANTGSAKPVTDEFFRLEVEPLLAAHCHECHSHAARRFKGRLALDSAAAVMTGGERGPAVEAGEPDSSLLIRAIRHEIPDLKMPHGKPQLPAVAISILERWVRDGAPVPKEEGRKDGKPGFTEEELAWWAIQAIRRPVPPEGEDGGWARSDIDRFVFKKLEAKGLKPSPEAASKALLRRVYFDLIGLPPTPEQIDAFLSDPSPDAYEKVVDSLLASNRYGEKWARHWLDLVRYADSDGYKADFLRPTAWRYRDYVIRSLNDDKPYDRFVREQIAGDELEPENPEALAATGYYRNAIYEYNNRDTEGQLQTLLADYTATTADVFMGVGLQCAECHDHKFDPLLQKDHFRLRAFFAGVYPQDDAPLATRAQIAAREEQNREWESATRKIRERIDEIRASSSHGTSNYAVGQFPSKIQTIYRKAPVDRTPYETQIADLVQRQLDYALQKVDGKIKGDLKTELLDLQKKLKTFDRIKAPELPTTLTVTDVSSRVPETAFGKGARRQVVEPGFPTILDAEPARISPPANGRTSGRRAALAEWLTRPDNPLSVRVIVNRLWQWHFGRGLAANTSDFGKLGEAPSHPELLDWLATRFVADGWSLKKMHRLMVTSSTYRQAAVAPAPEEATMKDPENRLLWKYPTRRLEAEQIRDAMLAVSGQLKDEGFGRGAGNVTDPRRSVYTKFMRNSPNPLLAVFDQTEGFTSMAERNVTTTPTQALLLFNSPELLRHSQAFARRLAGEVDDAARVRRGYRLAFGREPSAGELSAAAEFLGRHAELGRDGGAGSKLTLDKMPYRIGQAVMLSPKSAAEVLRVKNPKGMPTGDFTIEAFVSARSVYDSGSVRTIAAQWTENAKPGWSLGLTGMKSARKPRVLVLQLSGRQGGGNFGYEAIFSDLELELNKPYHLAVAVRLSDTGQGGVTFYVKDLTNEDEPTRVARWGHGVVSAIETGADFTIGGRAVGAGNAWDGMIDSVRLTTRALGADELLAPSERDVPDTSGYWKFEPKPGAYADSSGMKNDLEPIGADARGFEASPQFAALTDFCHVLLNSNEFAYVD